jgi:predicted nucleotidyltransferase
MTDAYQGGAAPQIGRDDALDVIHREFTAFDLTGRLIFLGEMGSTSHGTHQPDRIDDYDLMGVVIPPAPYVTGLAKWEHWVRPPGDDGLDVVLYSLAKYVRLLLKSNPNVMGLLWLRPEHVLADSAAWSLLQQHRAAFASKDAYHSFSGYAHAQLKKMQTGAFRGYMGEKRKAMVQRFGYDTKNAAHLIRLLRMSVEFLRTGEMQVWRSDRAELLAIKSGEWTIEQVQREAADLFEHARMARDASTLPDHPDAATAERIVMELHRIALARAA